MAAYAKLLKSGDNDIYPYTRASLVYMNSNFTIEQAYLTVMNTISEFSNTRGFIQFYDSSEIDPEDREPNTLYGRIIADYTTT